MTETPRFTGGVIYGLTDPSTGLVRYVGKSGKTSRSRLRAHLRAANAGGDLPLHEWLRGLNAEPGVVVLERDPYDRDAAEVRWIANLRAAGLDLLNVLNGGTGWSKGVPQSEEGNRKRSAKLREQGPIQGQIDGLAKAREAARAPEVRSRAGRSISAAKKGQPAHNRRVWTPELRERALEAYSRMSAIEAAKEIGVGKRAMFEFLRREGVIRKRTESADPNRKKHTAEARARMSEIKKQHHARGDYSRSSPMSASEGKIE